LDLAKSYITKGKSIQLIISKMPIIRSCFSMWIYWDIY